MTTREQQQVQDAENVAPEVLISIVERHARHGKLSEAQWRDIASIAAQAASVAKDARMKNQQQ